jgi:hypothetical protein
MATVLLPGAFARAGSHQTSDEEALRLQAVLAPIGNFRLAGVTNDGYSFGLMDATNQRVGAVYVWWRDGDLASRVHSRHYDLSIGWFSPTAGVIDTVIRGAHAIADFDGGAEPDQVPHPKGEPLDPLTQWTIGAVLVALVSGSWRGWRVITDLRLPHVLQVVAQSSIFLYWMLYWPGVSNHLPSLALQIVFAYACDATFCFSRFRSWRLGLSPLPVVFSINLFEWFDWHALVIAIPVAFWSKAYLHRAGRHIFNPSVAGLAVVGALSVLSPGFVHFGGLFGALNIPPNMAEWIILVSLIPQTRFRILPVSIGAMIACHATGTPAILRPAIILAFTLLASDPATTPATDLGKVLFGCVVGFGLPTLSFIMRHIGQPDDFAKVLSVAVGNVAAPSLDHMAGAIMAGGRRIRDVTAAVVTARRVSLAPLVRRLVTLSSTPIPNGVLVACWLMIVIPWLKVEKPRDFEPALHWNWNTPLVVRDADDVPRCAHNPVFCEPFSFPQEVALWFHRVHAKRDSFALR